MVINLEKIIQYIKDELNGLKLKQEQIEEKLYTNELDIQGCIKAIEKLNQSSDSTGMIFLSTDKKTGFDIEEIERLNGIISQLKSQQNDMISERDNITKKIKEIEDILSEKSTYKKQKAKYTSYDLINYVETERQRISGDIHDSIIQNLTALMYKIELIKKVMDTDHNRAKLELEAGNKIVKDCIGELRNIIFNLHPMSLDDLDTKSVFYDFIQKIKTSTNMIVDFKYKSDVEHVNNSIVVVLLRIIQELCNNSIKHSDGSRIDINVNISNNLIKIVQSDDGIGYDYNLIDKPKTTTDNTGYGLVLLKEKVGLINGTISVNTKKEGGTEYKLTVPIPKES
jgi:two-component system sensor histidine kinase DegS